MERIVGKARRSSCLPYLEGENELWRAKFIRAKAMSRPPPSLLIWPSQVPVGFIQCRR